MAVDLLTWKEKEDISNSMQIGWVMEMPKAAIDCYRVLLIINSDQLTHFDSGEFISYMKEVKTVSISIVGKGEQRRMLSLNGSSEL